MIGGFLHSLLDPSVDYSMWPRICSPAETFKVVVIDTWRVLHQWLRWQIDPLTGTLLLIRHSSADYISGVRTLHSHPQGVCVTGACGSICLASEERQPTRWARRVRTQTTTWTFLCERSEKRWNGLPKRCHTKLELTVNTSDSPWLFFVDTISSVLLTHLSELSDNCWFQGAFFNRSLSF